jgi:hypothetical protein
MATTTAVSDFERPSLRPVRRKGLVEKWGAWKNMVEAE